MKKLWIIITIGLLSSMALTGWAFLASSSNNPAEIVQKYWQYCLKQDFESAKKLKSNASERSPLSEDKNTGIVSGIAADTINNDGTVEDCCYLKKIAEQELKITKVIEEKTEGLNARVVVETENKDKHKENYVNCLVKLDSKWTITEVAFFDVDDSYTRDLLGIKDYCFPSKSKKQKEK